MAGDRAITQDLMARLDRHHIKPSAPLPGGIFVPEVGVNGAWGASARCDAIYVGFTSTSGRLLVGHEVKASRADWLTELGKPDKASTWADQCHEWWLVTVPGVVHEGELPAGWGLMVPGPSTTRMKIVHAAQRKPASHQPSWDAARSIMARLDTLRSAAIAEGVRKASDKIRADVEIEIERRVAARLGDGDFERAQRERDRAELQAFRNALGVTLVDEPRPYDPNAVTAEALGDLAALLRTSGNLADATESLVGRYGPVSSMRRHWEDLDQALREAVAATTPQQQKAGA